MKITFSHHSLEQLSDRGTTQEEVVETVQNGEQVPAKKGRLAFKKNFPFENVWRGRYYPIKQVMPIAVRERDEVIIVTVYVFFFGGEK